LVGQWTEVLHNVGKMWP